MRGFLIITILLNLFSSSMSAQKKPVINLNEAEKLRYEGKLDAAINAYRKVYHYDSSYSENIYNMATAFSLLGAFDSCFYYLYKANNLIPHSESLSDPDLYPVKKDKRWDVFERQLIDVLLQKNDTFFLDIDYARTLLRMSAADQAYYYDIQIAEKTSGKTAPIIDSIWNIKQKINDQNLEELEVLLNKEGWPKISEVGYKAASAAFLIIQHSTVEKQKKYLPVLKQLCVEKEASWQAYALMYDRIQTTEGRPQRFGSQVKYNNATNKYELYELEDETKVDEWRRDAGMGPLADYVIQWKIKFVPKNVK